MDYKELGGRISIRDIGTYWYNNAGYSYNLGSWLKMCDIGYLEKVV